MTHDDRTPGTVNRTAPRPGVPPTARRRTFLKAVGAGAVAAPLASGTAGANTELTEFVETDGTNFVVDGQPVYFNGTNNFYVTHETEGTPARIDRCLDLFEAHGIDVLRAWAHCEGKGGQCIQPEPGVYDQTGLQALDYLVAACKRRGIRLILTLVDNWEHEGGIPQYVEWYTDEEWSEGAEDAREIYELFYTDERVRQAYRDHVERILTRTNAITGVEYREEPAIAMWELANEPRLERGWTRDGQFEGDEHAEIYHQWIADMSSHVKELDPNHLVSTGAEGFFRGPAGEPWPADDWNGQDFVRDHSIDTIDACSFHMYPYHWPGLGHAEHMAEDDFVSGVEWIQQHATAAHEEVGKPVYCGEFNVNAQEHSTAARNTVLEQWYETFEEYDVDGVLPWQLVLDDTGDHDGFQIYADESGYLFEEYADVVAGKTGSDGPIADATAPDGLRVGESGSFGGAYSKGADGAIASYDWSFDDGGSASGERVWRSFETPGQVEAELTVTDEGGATASDTEAVTVQDLPEDSVLVEGGGEQVHDDVAEFHFASTTVSGDFTVEAKVATLAPTSPVAQAGILASNDADAARAIGGVATTPSNGTEQVRSYDESSPVWLERANDDRSPPVWLRLSRTGQTIATYVSEDGEQWTQLDVGGEQVAFDEEVHLGLFVSSNSPGDLCAAQFDEVGWLQDWSSTDVGDVAVAGDATAGGGSDGSPPDAPASVTVLESSPSSVELEWTGVAAATSYVLSVDGEQLATADGGETTATLTGLDLEPGATYAVGVAAANESGESPPTETTVTASTDSQCEAAGASAGETLADGSVVCDVDGDGAYTDVTGDGSVTNSDVTQFFGNQHASPWDDRPDLFDFTGDDRVSQADVIELFELVASQ